MTRNPLTPAEQVSNSLTMLSVYRPSVEAIDAYFRSNIVDESSLIMTSMGNRRRAMITPYYHALQWEQTLVNRLEWAGYYKRPFVEAVVSYRQPNRQANLVLRLCMLPENLQCGVLETAWRFQLDDPNGKIATLEDVVQKIALATDSAEPITHRTGIVNRTEERQDTTNWAISSFQSVEQVADVIHSSVLTELPFEK